MTATGPAAAHSEAAGMAGGGELEAVLERIEHHLHDLQAGLSARDVPRIESQAAELQKALSHAVERFAQAAGRGDAPLPLRRRLGLASAQVAAQRDALARATTALDRAIDALMPGHNSAALYSHNGVQTLRRTGSSLEA